MLLLLHAPGLAANLAAPRTHKTTPGLAGRATPSLPLPHIQHVDSAPQSSLLESRPISGQ